MMYRVFGLVVASDHPLPSVPTVAVGEPDVRVCYVEVPYTAPYAPLPSPSSWFMETFGPGGVRWCSRAKVEGGYLLRFHDLADFFVRADGREIVCAYDPEVQRATTQHLLLDVVIPLVTSVLARQVLHASAVLMAEGVVAFAGANGAGKSTVAGSFVSAGYPVISDDCLALEEKGRRVYAFPGYPGLRLWDDAVDWLFGENGSRAPIAHYYDDKHRVDVGVAPGAYCAEPHPLIRLYVLGSSTDAGGQARAAIEPLAPRDALIALVQAAFTLDVNDRVGLARQLQALGRVVSAVPVRRLVFPRDLRALLAVREAVLADLEGRGASR